MERLARLYHNAKAIELVGLGGTAIIFLVWGISEAAGGRWSHPLVWTPLFFLLARAFAFVFASRAVNRVGLMVHTLMFVAGSVAIIGGLIRHDEWLWYFGLGTGVWLAIGEGFWRLSDARYIAPGSGGLPSTEA